MVGYTHKHLYLSCFAVADPGFGITGVGGVTLSTVGGGGRKSLKVLLVIVKVVH